jgi:acetolactate decarboxylase
MKRYLLIVLVGGILGQGCQSGTEHSASGNSQDDKRPDDFYHYSIWTALVNKIYDGNLTVAEGKTKGDIGLGTYNGADGELIMLDGVMYHVPSSGVVGVASDSTHIPYLNATFFDKDFSFDLNGQLNYDSVRKLIQQHFPSRNYFYAFKIHAKFDSLKLGSLYKQEKPYTEGLDSLMPKRPKFEHGAVSGTMVGFYCPDFIGDINVAGFHLHFLSDDKKIGGHVMEFKGNEFNVEVDKLPSYHLVLPETPEFDSANLEKKFQYGKK